MLRDCALLILTGILGRLHVYSNLLGLMWFKAMTYSLWLDVTGEHLHSFSISLLTSLRKRDGQKRPVYIYRFLTAGTIDGGLSNKNETWPSYIIDDVEKIFQRQVTKLGLSNCKCWTGLASKLLLINYCHSTHRSSMVSSSFLAFMLRSDCFSGCYLVQEWFI